MAIAIKEESIYEGSSEGGVILSNQSYYTCSLRVGREAKGGQTCGSS